MLSSPGHIDNWFIVQHMNRWTFNKDMHTKARSEGQKWAHVGGTLPSLGPAGDGSSWQRWLTAVSGSPAALSETVSEAPQCHLTCDLAWCPGSLAHTHIVNHKEVQTHYKFRLCVFKNILMLTHMHTVLTLQTQYGFIPGLGVNPMTWCSSLSPPCNTDTCP